MKEKFTFFWGGVFSQWQLADITIDGKTFNCCEQYMMYKKAMLFNDTEIAEQIMKTHFPNEQKALGRKVKNFDKNAWEEIANEVVYEANYAKFTQNLELQPYLLDTDDTTLVEASKFDKIWGIGLTEDDPLAQDRSTWKGTNWLGIILTAVRENLMVELSDK